MSTQIYEVSQQSEQVLGQFLHLTRRYAVFHSVFILVFLGELLALLLFMPFLAKSFLLAALVAMTVLTAFAYFVLRFYFQTKKPEQFLTLRDQFVESCQRYYQSNTAEARWGFLQAIYHLIQRLDGQEYQYYQIPLNLEALTPLVKKFSVWCHFADVQLMRELLHTYCIRTQLGWIKTYPTDLELHRSLGHAYIALYKIYQDPTRRGESVFSFIASEYASPETQQNFFKAAHCAAEELKIVLHYAPHDLRALASLGHVYHDLDQKEEERKVYEALLQLSPQEKEIRFRLGALYFELGFMAQGLRIYEDLKKAGDPNAETLIKTYDQFHLN
jgi:tetratricopeptide (TPR) repeat protein